LRFGSVAGIGESSVIGGLLGDAMTRAYSHDLRQRVIAAVEGGASRREAAERFEISVSSAIRWLERWTATGCAAAEPQGGSRSPLEDHASWLLDLIAAQPDLTLEEVVAAMHKRGIAGSRTAVWRFFERHEISFKKKFCTPASKRGLTWLGRVGGGSDNSIFSIPPPWYFSTRRRPPRTWFECAGAAPGASAWSATHRTAIGRP
jgi:transposase